MQEPSNVAAKSEGVDAPVEWTGTARYEVLRCIGRGGMGVVYEALDRERGERVALKALLNYDAAALYLFKQEFRTLADVHHPNLVRLHELVATDRVFFAMELVRGADFLAYVRTPGAGIAAGGPEALTLRTAALDRADPKTATPAVTELDPAAPVDHPAETPRTPCPANLERLRHALCQLVEGIEALHAAGKLHRDIKPSNVLVTPEGRVVVLDFGVATELPRVPDENLREGDQFVGTARYMAPEQSLMATPTAASDWYSVGVVLFEALVGRAPFYGSSFDVIRMKNEVDAPAPSERVDGVPEDLDQLCRSLLQRAPEKRPTGAQILHPLRAARTSDAPAVASTAPTRLVGREAHSQALRDAFEATRAGKSITVRVSGRAGMGKSALLQDFLDGLVENGNVVVLRGRAYERETVPYKAVDSVIDALSRHLMVLGDQDDTVILPKDIWALARLFPVLRRVSSIASTVEEPVLDPNRVRRRAFTALRELMMTLTRRRPLVLYVDDAQWGDTDSAALLAELVRPPFAPPVLIVLAHREENLATAAFLADLRSRWPLGAEIRDVNVGPLETTDAQQLALALLGGDDGTAQKMADAVARESAAIPFLIEELSRSATQRLLVDSDARITLEEMVAERLHALPDDARRLVEMIAVGGWPLPTSSLRAASGIDSTGDVIALLTNQRFVRPGLRNGREVVEAVHDRIRETIVAQLAAPVVREHHGRLAHVLEATPGADPEAIATHFFGAGEAERGAIFAERAAEQAASQLAFDHAAHLFGLTLDSLPASSPNLRRLRIRLGEVLGWAGRAKEAGRAYLAAAEGAPPLERLDLERTASAQLIAAGSTEEGGRVLRRVLANAGVRAPRTPLGALFWLLVYSVWLRVTRLRLTERDPEDVRPEDRVRIDAMHVAALGLASVDVTLATCMQARQLAEALRAGDRTQVLSAAVMYHSGFARHGGRVGGHERDAAKLIARLVERDKNAPEVAFARGLAGVGMFLRGRWKDGLETIDESYANANVRGQRAGWQGQTQLYGVYALVFLGNLVQLRPRYERMVAEAELRGAAFMSVMLRASHPILLCLAHDDLETARRQMNESKAQWVRSAYSVQDWQIMRSEAEIELYAGDGLKAARRLEQDARPLRRSFLLTVQFLRGLTAFTRGRAAIASIDAAPEKRATRVAEARRAARELARERMTWTAPLAAIVTAAAASASGDRGAAAKSLRSAIDLALAADMSLYAAAAQHQLGLLLVGDEGKTLVQQAEEAMTAQDVRAPARFASMFVPGRWEP